MNGFYENADELPFIKGRQTGTHHETESLHAPVESVHLSKINLLKSFRGLFKRSAVFLVLLLSQVNLANARTPPKTGINVIIEGLGLAAQSNVSRDVGNIHAKFRYYPSLLLFGIKLIIVFIIIGTLIVNSARYLIHLVRGAKENWRNSIPISDEPDSDATVEIMRGPMQNEDFCRSNTKNLLAFLPKEQLVQGLRDLDDTGVLEEMTKEDIVSLAAQTIFDLVEDVLRADEIAIGTDPLDRLKNTELEIIAELYYRSRSIVILDHNIRIAASREEQREEQRSRFLANLSARPYYERLSIVWRISIRSIIGQFLRDAEHLWFWILVCSLGIGAVVMSVC